MDRSHKRNRRWPWAAAYVSLWTGLALLSAVEAFVAQEIEGKPVAWTLALGRAFKEWYAFGLVALGILWFAGRVRFESGRLARWIAFHMAAATVVTLVYVALVSAWMAGEKSVQTGEILTFAYLFKKLSIYYFVPHLTMYWMVVLAHLGWTHYGQARERERQSAALATELVQARLQALRMQINPHFLFNTLNTISALVHENPAAADRMIVRLSELLRRTLDRGDTQEVPLREEMDFLRAYLEIEQMRFQERLSVKFDIQPQALDLLVPHLILQPLVENAIRHGVEPCEEPGVVEVSARVGGDRLELRVRDHGNGLADASVAPERPGIGLANVRSRLAHLYGSAQSLELRNLPSGGAEAVAVLPCCTVARSQNPRVVVMAGEATDPKLQALTVNPSAKEVCC